MSFIWPTINKGFLYVRLGSQSLRIVTRVSLFLASERASEANAWGTAIRLYVFICDLHGISRDLNQRLRTWESVGLRTVSSTLTITLFSRTEFFTCHRFLAFSPSPIESTFVEIDGSPLELPATQVEGPLFACQWDPDKYSSGIHSMTVKVQVHYHPRFFQSREKNFDSLPKYSSGIMLPVPRPPALCDCWHCPILSLDRLDRVLTMISGHLGSNCI